MVTVLSGVRGDTRRYRTLHLYEQLCLTGVDCQCLHLMDPRLWEKLKSVQVVLLHRVAYDGFVTRLLNRLYAQNALVVMDTDDFLYDMEVMQWIDSPDFQDPIRARSYYQELMRHRKTLDRCDAVMVSTGALAKTMEQFGKPVWIHRNAFSLEMLARAEAARARKPSDAGKVIIGYASGTPTHNRDFELVKPALQAVMRRDPRVVLRLVGPLDPGAGWEGLENRIERLKLVPWRKLPGILAGFDINLAPLVMDNPFAQSKSEIKYMEAAMVETPTIASATDAFRFAIRDGQTGLLVDTPEGWESAVERLTQDASLRVEMGQRAYQAVIEEYHPVTRATQLVQTLDEMSQKLRGQPFWQEDKPDASAIAERARSMSRGKRWLPRRYEKDPSNLELGLYSLRHRGLKTLARQVWIYFRRLVAPIFPFRRDNE